MTINADTKIAALLKQNPEALEAIVSLSPDFKKLRNPILRKLMAGRTSIAMAAKIGGCQPEDFFNKLAPLGFEVGAPAEKKQTIRKDFPSYLKGVKPEQIISLDVRSMLSEGKDPLQLILQAIKQLKEEQVLKIINSFEPAPLIALLKKQGFEFYAEHKNEQLVETWFYRTKPAPNTLLEVEVDPGVDWAHAMKRFEGKLETVDVRAMEMPGPMMTILEALEHLAPGKALYVYHKRIPVFLLTELKERQFDYRIKEISDSEVHLLIFKN